MGPSWRRACWAAAIVAVAGFGAVVLLAPSGPVALALDSFGTTLAAALAGLSCLRAARATAAAGDRVREEGAWRLLGLSGLAWAAGNTAWAVQELALGDDVPFPSAADAGYLVAVVLLLFGVMALGPPLRGIATLKRALDVALIAVVLIGVGWAVVLAPVASSAESGVAQALALTYAIGDLVIVAVVLSVISLLRHRPWALGLLLTGVSLLAVADATFAVLTAEGRYQSGTFAAWAWFTGFVCMALSARPLPPQQATEPGAVIRRQDWPAEVVGHLPAVAVGSLAVQQRLVEGQISLLVLGLILVVGVLNALRHLTASRQTADLNQALARQVEALQQEQERTTRVIDEARDPYVEMTAEGVVTVWNGPAEQVFGWTRDQVVGRPIADIVPVENRAASQERIREYVASGDAGVWDEGVDVRYLRPDGTEVPIEIAAWHTGDGESYRIHAFVWDISERMAEQALLEASERRWRSLIQHSSDITVVIDADGSILGEVPNEHILLGFDEEDFTGRHFGHLLHPDEADDVATAFARVVADPDGQERMRLRLRRIDGSWAHVEAIVSNLLDEPTVAGIVCNLRDVSEQVAAENELKRQARRDPLTGLPNRNLMTNALAARCHVSGDGRSALLLMDLDGFKDINDGLGHDVGDQLLVEIGHRLDRVTRADDVVARLGGDEFAVLLSGLASDQAAVNIAENLGRLIQEPVRLGQVTLEVGVSIGIASCQPGDDPLAVLQRADVAMYRAKRQGSGHAVYGSGDDEERRNSVKVAADLRSAIDHGDLVVHYQPKIELATGMVDSVEALVRWQHPVRGLLAPDEFIALAERTGLIRDLTDRVLELALQQCATWRAEGLDVPVAVNLSPRVLGQTDLVAAVRRALEENGVSPGRLTLEITETAFPENPRALSSTLDQLGELGVRLAVDDFGTGWSSLSKLKELPVQELKIDRSFVFALAEDATDHSIVRSILDLARSLNLTVVAEGVETPEVLELLETLGCPLAQGYLFSRPQPGSLLTGWMLAWERERLARQADERDAARRRSTSTPPSP